MPDFNKMTLPEIEQWYVRAKATYDGLKTKIDSAIDKMTELNDAGQELTILSRSRSERAEIDEHLVKPADIPVIVGIGVKKVTINPTKYITVKEANDNGLGHIVGYKIVKSTYTKK